MARLTTLLVLSLLVVAVWAGTPSEPALVSAKAAILMDRDTGLVLWSHNADQALPMASTTKIMTAMVILDHAADKLDDPVVISQRADAVEGSSQFGAGDTVRLRDLLIGSLVKSSNEATIAAAEYLTPTHTMEEFVGWMNDKAAEMGLRHTRFANTHGLHHPQHYSSARDLALIAREAQLRYPLIREIVQIRFTKVKALPRGDVVLENRNKLLGKPVPGIPGSVVDGMKTGYVNQAGRCLVASATLHDWQLIAVVLNSPDMFSEVNTLFHHGFTRWEWRGYRGDQPLGAVPVAWGGAAREVPVGGTLGWPMPRLQYTESGAEDAVVVVGPPVKAPVQAGDRVGTLEVRRAGETILTAPAIALQDVPLAWWTRLGLVLFVAGVAMAVLGVMGWIYGTRAKNARRRRRLQQATGREAHIGRPGDSERRGHYAAGHEGGPNA